MIRWTARSVIPTRTATSRSTGGSSVSSRTRTCVWLVMNVHFCRAEASVDSVSSVLRRADEASGFGDSLSIGESLCVFSVAFFLFTAVLPAVLRAPGFSVAAFAS